VELTFAIATRRIWVEQGRLLWGAFSQKQIFLPAAFLVLWQVRFHVESLAIYKLGFNQITAR
jgi:hypothetical protein